jgi:hypothetical protein
VCFGLTRKKWSYILIVEGKGRAIGVMDPRGAGAALSCFSQGINFTPTKEVGNSLLERWSDGCVKEITLPYNMFLL